MKCLLNQHSIIKKPAKLVATTLLATSLALLPACNNKTEKDSFTKEKIEYVISTQEKQENQTFINKVIDYDKSRLENKEKVKNWPLMRIGVSGIMALLGGIIGCFSNKEKTGAAIGGIVGATLPGISISAVLSGITWLLSGAASATFLPEADKKVMYTLSGLITAAVAAMLFL